MVNKCIICGKSVSKSVATPSNPKKHVCLSCLNELVFNANTIGSELEPITKALSNALSAFKEGLKNEEGKND
jgi:hypothetical protein